MSALPPEQVRRRNLITAAILVLFFCSLIAIAIHSSIPS